MIPNLNKPSINWAIEKKIFIKDSVVPLEMCNDLIEYGSANVMPGKNKYIGVFSNKFDSCLLPLNHPIHDILSSVWKEIIEHFQFSIDFIEPYELKRYENDGFFGKHIDNYYGLDQPLDRKLTMVVQLSDITEYKGGSLKIIDRFMPKNRGSIIAFPSYFPHEVIKTLGCRWSLIGWAWGPYWI